MTCKDGRMVWDHGTALDNNNIDNKKIKIILFSICDKGFAVEREQCSCSPPLSI